MQNWAGATSRSCSTNSTTGPSAAPSNFRYQLPAADSELAQQLTRDLYVLDFLDLTGPAAEKDLEAALMARLQDFLLELGHGFAFVGRQYRFEVTGGPLLPRGLGPALAVADYTYDALPAAIQAAVPTDAELVAALDEIEADVDQQTR